MLARQIFLLFFHSYFFFVYQHSDLDGCYSNGTKTRHVNLVVASGRSGSQDMTLGCLI